MTLSSHSDEKLEKSVQTMEEMTCSDPIEDTEVAMYQDPTEWSEPIYECLTGAALHVRFYRNCDGEALVRCRVYPWR